MGAPFQAVVLPGRTDARHSTAHGDGLRLSVAGVPASFVIVAADAFGNERSVCGDNFQASTSLYLPYRSLHLPISPCGLRRAPTTSRCRSAGPRAAAAAPACTAS